MRSRDKDVSKKGSRKSANSSTRALPKTEAEAAQSDRRARSRPAGKAACDTAIAENNCRPRSQGVGDAEAVRRSERDLSEREAIYNGRARGPVDEIACPVEQVAAICGFMIDIDTKLLDPNVVGEDAAAVSQSLYDQHVSRWLERDPVLAKAEVRDTGGGLHVLLILDEPLIVAAGQQRRWDEVARGLLSVLPSDPRAPGINVMTRPIGAINLKYAPPREVRLLREGKPVSKAEILGLVGRVVDAPARLWMSLFCGGERVSPCPLCRKENTSLGVAGAWQLRCYECGRVDATAIVYRFYSEDFLISLKEVHRG
jgi:hypothetical protein